VYFAIRGRYLWALANVVLATIALKRIVLLASFAALLFFLLPERFKRIVLRPSLALVAISSIVVFSIEFAYGYFDGWILETFDQSANALSRGRQVLWRSALDSIDFTYGSFFLTGAGLGEAITVLKESYQVDRILLHNDFMTITLEHGILVMLAFAYLLNRQPTWNGRILAVYISVLFVTDNVMIYQHVMIPFMLLLSKLNTMAPGKQAEESGSDVLSRKRDRYKRMFVAANE
jgi:hypothetical protein